jgi:AcrR family transcriptional regulator
MRKPGAATSAVDKTAAARARIFDAVSSWAASTGLRKLSMDEVAHRARVGRATLYKYFPGRDALIEAFVHHELATFFAEVQATVERHTEPDERLVHGFAHAYRLLSRHPAIGPVLRLNPELLLPYVIGEQSYALDLGRSFVDTMTPAGDLPDHVRAAFAEYVARAFHTLILIPSTVFGLDEPDGAEDYARNYVLPVKHHLASTAP